MVSPRSIRTDIGVAADPLPNTVLSEAELLVTLKQPPASGHERADAGYVWVRHWCRIMPNLAALCSGVGL